MEKVYDGVYQREENGGTQEKLLPPPPNGEKKHRKEEKRKSETARRRPDLAAAQKGGQKERDRMEDLGTGQAPSKHIRERVQRGSFNNAISIQADNGSSRPDNGSSLST